MVILRGSWLLIALGALGCSSATSARDAAVDSYVPPDTGAIQDCGTATDADNISTQCARFSCQVANASLTHCLPTAGGTSSVSFRCTGVEGLSASYRNALAPYFTDCGPMLLGLTPQNVMIQGGRTYVSEACPQLNCAVNLAESARGTMADCAPLPLECVLPDPS